MKTLLDGIAILFVMGLVFALIVFYVKLIWQKPVILLAVGLIFLLYWSIDRVGKIKDRQ